MITIRHNRMPTLDKTIKETPPEEFLAQPVKKPRIKIIPGSIGSILKKICAKHGTIPDEVLSKSRTKNIVEARKEFIRVLHFKHLYSSGRLAHMLNMDLTSIKHYLGERKKSEERYEVLRERYS